jgi:predicted dehydrogenase
MSGIGVGVIGTGYMGKCHALAWNAVAAVFGDVARPRLLVQCDESAARAAEVARAFGFARSTDNWRDVVDDPQVEIISIAAPNHLHAEMTLAALARGKHVWCEKPMATSLADATRMRDAARGSGRVAALGYNYIQNPALRLMRDLVARGEIGRVHQIRIEMDEDFMADGAAPFGLRNESRSGYGALDDFGVHALSLIAVLVGRVAAITADLTKPFAERASASGGRRAVENWDAANILLRTENGAAGVIALNRAAWGRKNRIQIQVFGATGTLSFDQERLNEVQLFTATGDEATRGFRTILCGPAHPPFAKFVPAPGHGLGFNDLKIIECRELLARIAGARAYLLDFEDGLAIERSFHAAARAAESRRWVMVEHQD